MIERESRSDLHRLRGDDVLGGLAGGAPPTPPIDQEPADAVEIWARKTGRTLAALTSIGLIGWILLEAAKAP